MLKLIVENTFSKALNFLHLFENEYIKSLEAASDRMALDLYASVTKLNEVGYTDEPYLKSLNKNSLFRACEMILTMKNDLEQNDIRSCLCKMTPVLLIVADEFLKSKKCDLNRVRIPRRGEDYIDVDKFRILWPDLYEKCRTYFLSYPKYGYASNTLINIIQYIDTDDRKTVENLKTLREIEENARNLVAHELVKITHKQFVEMTGLKPEDIIRLLIETIGKISPQFLPKTYWNGYDKMKAFLKEQLHKM